MNRKELEYITFKVISLKITKRTVTIDPEMDKFKICKNGHSNN